MSHKEILKKYDEKVKITGSEFMEVWSHYDKNKSGKLEYTEINEFMQDLLLKKKRETLTESDILTFTDTVISLINKYDINRDGFLELDEMELLLKVTKNNLIPADTDVDSILSNYDPHHKGYIEGSQIKELCADLLRHHEKLGKPDSIDLDDFVADVLQKCDMNQDNHLDSTELQLFLKLYLKREPDTNNV